MGQGRHRRRRLSSPTTWLAFLVAACIAGAVALSTTPADARSVTVPVQLTLSGVASADNPTGGAVVGIHPGDSVKLTSSAVPTAGVPAVLGAVINGLLGQVAGFQVVIKSGSLPGVKYPVKLGTVSGCSAAGGKGSIDLKSLAKGTYRFTYVVDSISAPLLGVGGLLLGGCNATQITPTKDQIGKLTANNVKISDNAVYSGSIVAATNPPKGQIGVQLPSQSISAKAGPISTSVNVPGATVTVPNPVPVITSNVGGLVSSVVNRVTGGNKSTPAKGGRSSTTKVKYTPPALTVPQKVMPHAVNVGGGGATAATGFAAPAGGTANGPLVAPAVTSTAPNPNATSAVSTPSAKPAGKSVDLADRSQLGGQQLPALLAILAILALSLVTAAYARLVLLRRKA